MTLNNQNTNNSRPAASLTGSSDSNVLCGASAYELKFYINPIFSSLPTQIKEELRIICITFTAENGGIFTMEFEDDGELMLKTSASESDFSYDEIGAQLRIKQLTDTKRELFASLEAYYRIFILGETPAENGNA